jgi:predicted metalloprotease with PDZ domain
MAVGTVTGGSAAERAGLQSGDTILEINGKIAGQDASQEMSRVSPGDMITVKIRGRRGAERELKWKVGSREEGSYEMKDLDAVTPEQRARRAAWLKGEAETYRAK